MEKNWDNTIIEVVGTLKADETGKISFKAHQYGKYTATLKVAADTAWSRLARRTTFVFIDGLRPADVEDLKALEEAGEISKETRLVFTGHVVKTPGKPGLNDLLNLKTLGIRPAVENEIHVVNFDDALTKDEWQVIRKEKFGGTSAQVEAPSAPVAPAVPF